MIRSLFRRPRVATRAWHSLLFVVLASGTAVASVTVTFDPPNPIQGEPIRVTLTNHGPENVVLPSSCLFNGVHPGDCSTDPILIPNCLHVITIVPPGGEYSSVWDQRNDDGDYVKPGTYAFSIGGLCPSVTITGTCSKPPEYVGEAKPGTAFLEPRLELAGGMPESSNAGFALRVELAVGGSSGLLIIGISPAMLPVGGGHLYVDVAAPHVLLPFQLSGAAGTPGAGIATLPLPIPAAPTLHGLPIHTQALILDVGAGGGLAHTRGLYFSVCPN